jgi:hypothetical protein
MKVAVNYPDPEHLLVPVLAELLDEHGVEASCGVGRPDGWTPADGLHVEVAWDGTPEIRHPLVAWPTVRIVVHGPADQPTLVKELALLCLGVLPSQTTVAVRPLTGVGRPVADPDRPEVYLAAFTCRVTTRATALEPSGS